MTDAEESSVTEAVRQCFSFLSREDFEDALVPIQHIKQRIGDVAVQWDSSSNNSNIRIGASDADLYWKRQSRSAIWAALCGREDSKDSSSPQPSLLVYLQTVRDRVCLTDDGTEAKALKASCEVLLDAVVLMGLRELPRGPLLQLKDTVWKTFVTLNQVDRRGGVRTTCLSILLRMVRWFGPGGGQSNDDDIHDEGEEKNGGAAPKVQLTEKDVNAVEVMKHCMTLSERRSESMVGAKAVALQLLGALSLSYAAQEKVSALFPKVFTTFLTVSKKLTESLNQTLGEGFFLGLRDFLQVYLLQFSEPKDQPHIVTIHRMIINAFAGVCGFGQAAYESSGSHHYKFVKAALSFFRFHAESTLVECVVSDAVRYLELFKKLWTHKNVEVHRGAYPAAVSYFRAIARQAEGVDDGLKSVLESVEAMLPQVNPKREELMFAIVAYGYMARPIRRLFGEDSIKRSFGLLSNRCETLLSSFSTEKEDIIRLLPPVINAFAFFILELDTIPTVGIETVRVLLEHTIRLYAGDHYFEKIRLVTTPALLRLFTSLRRHASSGALLSLFCVRLLQVVTGCGTDSVAGEGPMEGEPLDEDDPDAPIVRHPGTPADRVRLYAELIRRLLGAAVLRRSADWDYLWDLSEVRLTREQLRVEVQQATLTLLLQLDLGVKDNKEDTGTTTTVSLSRILGAEETDFSPRNAEHYDYFLRLVEFYADIASVLWKRRQTTEKDGDGATGEDYGTALRLQEWGTTLINFTQTHGYVSGFFRLLYTTLEQFTPHREGDYSSSSFPFRDAFLTELSGCLEVCRHRLYLYSGELLYQCSMLVLVASDVILTAAYPSTVSLPALTIAFKEVFSAEVTVEELFRESWVEKNKTTAMGVLERRIRAQPEWASEVIPHLLQARLVHQKTGIVSRLLRLSSQYGILIAEAIRYRKKLAGPEGASSTALYSHLEAHDPICKLDLPFSSVVLPFPLYELLDPVIDLCLNGEGKVSVTAGELFHLMVIWTIAKPPLHAWLEKLIPTVVHLASRPSLGITQELFHDVLMQSSHHFAVLKGGEEHFSKALYHTLQDKEANARRTSAEALVEYLILCRPGEEGGTSRVQRVIQRLRALFISDSPWARIGASTAIQLALTAYVEGRLHCERTEVGKLLQTVLQCLQVTYQSNPKDELGILEELMGAIRTFLVILKDGAVGFLSEEEKPPLVQFLLRHAVCVAGVSWGYTADLLTLLERVVSSSSLKSEGTGQPGGRMAHWMMQHASYLEEECTHHLQQAPNTTLESLQHFVVLYTTLGKKGWLPRGSSSTVKASGVKRERNEAEEKKVAEERYLLFDTVVNAVVKQVELYVESDFFKEYWKTDSLLRKVGQWSSVLLYFFRTFSVHESEKHYIQSTLLTPSLCRLVTAGVLSFTPVGVAPSFCHQDTLRVEAPNVALLETVRDLIHNNGVSWQNQNTTKDYFLESLKQSVPAFLKASSPTEALQRYWGNPFVVTRQVVASSVLVRVPSFYAPDENLWSEISVVNADTLQKLLCEVLLKTNTNPHSVELHRSLLVLLLGLDWKAFSRLVQCLSLPVVTAEDSTVVEVDVPEAEEKERQRRQTQLQQDQYQRRLDSFFQGVPVALQSIPSTAVSALLKEICGQLKEMIQTLLSSKEGGEEEEEISDKEGNDAYAELPPLQREANLEALENSTTASAFRSIIKALLGGLERTLPLRETVCECLKDVLLKECTSIDYVTAFVLKTANWLLQVDNRGIAHSTTLHTVLTEILTQSIDVRHWEKKPHLLLVSKRSTYLVKLSCQVLYTALRDGSRSVTEEEETTPPAALTVLADVGAKGIKAIVDNELPIDWKELPSESIERENYFTVVNAILTASRSILPRCPDCLVALLPLLGMTDLPLNDRLTRVLDTTLKRMGERQLLGLCETCVQLQQSPLPPSVWWAATYRVSLPVIRSLSSEARVQFFAQHVKSWVQCVSAEHTSLNQQVNAYVLLESMYRLVDSAILKTTINDAFTEKKDSEGKELTVKLIQLCSKARTARPTESSEEVVSLRQAAFRCLATLLMATQGQEPVFVSLLLSRSKNPNALNYIVNSKWLEEDGALPLETNFTRVPEGMAKDSSDWELRYRHRLQQRQKEFAALAEEVDEVEPPVWDSFSLPQEVSIVSQVSTTSVLSQYTLPPPRSSPDNVTIELDKVWSSTCMGTLLSLVDFLIERFSAPGVGEQHAPLWVKEMASILSSGNDRITVKLVIVRLLLLRASFFQRYADLLGEKMLSVVTDEALGNRVHYVAREVLVLLMSWMEEGHWEVTAPSAQKGVTFLLQNGADTASSTNTRQIVKHNAELFRALYSQVKPLVSVSCTELNQLVGQVGVARESTVVQYGCQVCGVLTDQGTTLASTGSLEDVRQLYQHLTALLSPPSTAQAASSSAAKDQALAAAEIIAMELSLLSSSDGEERTQEKELETTLRTNVAGQITQMKSEKDTLEILRIMVSRDPLLLGEFSPHWLFANYANLPSERQTIVLDLIGAVPTLAEKFYNALHTQFAGVLENYADIVKVYFFELITKLIPHLEPENLSRLRSAFWTEKVYDSLRQSEDGKAAFIKSVTSYFQTEGVNRKEVENQELLRLVTQQGLTDGSSFVQDKVLEYLDKHHMGPDLKDRWGHLLEEEDYHQTRESWPRHASILILSLLPKEASFRHPLFSPLANDVLFTPKIFSVTTRSSRGAAAGSLRSQRFTPLFSQSLSRSVPAVMAPAIPQTFYPSASQARERGAMPPPTSTLHQQKQQLVRRSQGGFAAGHSIPSSLLAPSETSQFTFHSTRSFKPSLSATSRLTFTRKTPRNNSGSGSGEVDEEVGMEDTTIHLPKRIRTEAPLPHLMAKSVQKKKERQIQEKVQSEVASRQFVVFRQYNEGDIPDVQVSLQAFVTPLQALCLFDSSIASLVCRTLLRASFDWLEQREREDRKNSSSGSGGDSAPEGQTNTLTILRVDHNTRELVLTFRETLQKGLRVYTENCLQKLAFIEPPVFPLTLEYMLRFLQCNSAGIRITEAQLVAFAKVFMDSGASFPQDSILQASEALAEALNLEKQDSMTFTQWMLLSSAHDVHDSGLSIEAARHCLPEDGVAAIIKAEQAAQSGSLTTAETVLDAWVRAHPVASLSPYTQEEAKRIHKFMRRERLRASVALLHWTDTWEAVEGTPTSPFYVPAALRCGGDGDTRDHLMEMLSAPSALHAFERGGLLLEQGDASTILSLAESSLQRLFRTRPPTSEGVEWQYQQAYRLFSLLRCGEVLQQIQNETPNAVETLRHTFLNASQDRPLRFSLPPRLLDEVLWLQQNLGEAVGKNTKVAGEWVVPLRDQLSQLQVDTLCYHGEHLLGTTTGHGSLESLLMTTKNRVKQYLKKEERALLDLLTLTARERMYSGLFNIPWGNTSTDVLPKIVKGLAAYIPKMNPVDALKVELDYAYCSVWVAACTNPHKGGVYAQCTSEITQLETNLTQEDAIVPFLDLLDHLLTDCDDAALWLTFVRTLGRALRIHGTTPLLANRQQENKITPIYCVPRFLQLFSSSSVDRTSLQTPPWVAALEELLTLPAVVWRPWTSSILSCLIQSAHPFVARLLHQLLLHYSQTVYYPYSCVKLELRRLRENNHHNAELLSTLETMDQFIKTSPRLRRVRLLVKELSRLCDPAVLFELQLKKVVSHLKNVEGGTDDSSFHRACAMDAYQRCKDMFDPTHTLDEEKVTHSFAKRLTESKLLERFLGPDGQLANLNELTTKYGEWKKENQSSGATEGREAVAHYSVKLEQVLSPSLVDAEELPQLPQQPLLLLNQSHAEESVILTGVDPVMTVMRSLEKPKRLTLYSTQHENRMLLKCNEDLRLDQRIQDVFHLSNTLLQRGSASAHLYIRTYSVIPLSDSVGLIEWVPDTTTLHDLIAKPLYRQSGLTPQNHPALIEYRQRQAKQMTSGSTTGYTKDPDDNGQYTQWFEQLTQAIPPHYLSSSLQGIGPGLREYYHIRKRFIETHATFSLVSYLFGIGDRHLSNCLVDLKTGDAVSIDFGHAFGSATAILPVPELVPFRLSPQMRAVQGVLGDRVTALPMTNVLHALRQHRGVILSITTAFASEPLSHWRPKQITPMVMMDSVKEKLNLENPRELMYRLASTNPFMKRAQQLKGIRKVLFDGAATTPSREESEESFVESLIDMATDGNLVGRIYVGWMPIF